MPEILLRLLIPAILGVSLLYALAEVSWRRRRARQGRPVQDVYPGSLRHQQDLEAVRNGTAPNLTLWRHMSGSDQAAWDEQQIAAAARREAAAGPAVR
jgi:hypothetical protein